MHWHSNERTQLNTSNTHTSRAIEEISLLQLRDWAKLKHEIKSTCGWHFIFSVSHVSQQHRNARGQSCAWMPLFGNRSHQIESISVRIGWFKHPFSVVIKSGPLSFNFFGHWIPNVTFVFACNWSTLPRYRRDFSTEIPFAKYMHTNYGVKSLKKECRPKDRNESESFSRYHVLDPSSRITGTRSSGSFVSKNGSEGWKMKTSTHFEWSATFCTHTRSLIALKAFSFSKWIIYRPPFASYWYSKFHSNLTNSWRRKFPPLMNPYICTNFLF